MEEQTAELFPEGTVIGEFRLESLIGRGAMAAVYRAVQISLERPVAVKILPHEFANDSDFVERFFNEAKAAAALSHPHIVQAYDAGITDENVCYFAMEFVEGENLLEKIDREGTMHCTMALQIMLDMARALAYGWYSQKLNHGDLKPANIMLNQRGEAKLADFGLAKIGELETEDDGIMLTPLYAAPEMIMGENEGSDCRTDIYSYGATLYHLLTGMPPFPGEDPEEVMDKQVYAPLVPVSECNSTIPEDVCDAVSWMLNKNPHKRPQSWEQVIGEMEELLRKNIRAMAVTSTPAEGAADIDTELQSEGFDASASEEYRQNDEDQEENANQSSTIQTSGSGRLIILLVIIALIIGIILGVYLHRSQSRQYRFIPPANEAENTIVD